MSHLTLTPWNDDHAAADLAIELPEAVAAVLAAQSADLRALVGSDGAAKPLVYEPHKRGKNWLAKLVGKNAANMDRVFVHYQNGVFDFQAVAPFTALEFGADYYSGSGTPHRNREYGVMIESARDDRWVFASTTSAATALKLARALTAAAATVPAVAPKPADETPAPAPTAEAETPAEVQAVTVTVSDRERAILLTALRIAAEIAEGGPVSRILADEEAEATADDFRAVREAFGRAA